MSAPTNLPSNYIPTVAQLNTNFGNKVTKPPNQTGKTWKWNRAPSPRTQAVALQNSVFMLAYKPKVKAQELCRLAGIWAVLEEKRQILFGFGRPKPVEARNSRSKSKRPAGQTVLGDDPSAELPNVAAPAKIEPEAHNP